MRRCSAARGTSATPRTVGIDTPFVIQSGLVDRDDKRGDLGFGVEDYLIKPFSKNELVACMEQVLSRLTQTTASTVVAFPTLHKSFPAESPDRREHRRFATVKAAEIIDGEERPSCVILNISYGGAALRLTGQQVPEVPVFKLRFLSGMVLQCRVCWQLGDKIGVRFVEAKGG